MFGGSGISLHRSQGGSVDVGELFAERVADYRATVRRTTADELAATIAVALAGRNVERLVVPAVRLPAHPPLSHAELDAADGTLTGCTVAIAETGTVVLDAGPDQGRRALSLLPDYHLCVVRAAQDVGDVPEALGRLDPQHRTPAGRGRPRAARPRRGHRRRTRLND